MHERIAIKLKKREFAAIVTGLPGLPFQPKPLFELFTTLSAKMYSTELRRSHRTEVIQGLWPTKETFERKTDRTRELIKKLYHRNGDKPIDVISFSAGCPLILTAIFDPKHKQEMKRYVHTITTIAGPVNEFRVLEGDTYVPPDNMKPLIGKMKKWYPALHDLYIYYLDKVFHTLTEEDKKMITNIYGENDNRVPRKLSEMPGVTTYELPESKKHFAHQDFIRRGSRMLPLES